MEPDEILHKSRSYMRGDLFELPNDYETCQEKHLPQPPLVKEAMRSKAIALPGDFSSLNLEKDVFALFRDRHSSRFYSGEKLSLQELSWLLWATQGVKEIRGKSYATIRTVACGGARHEFECYFFGKNLEGLEDGIYHYLPMKHAVELLQSRASLERQECVSMEELMSRALNGQNWGAKANLIICYSIVCRRMEWRYGVECHRISLIDAGHVTGNLYLAAEAAKLGTCAIGAVDGPLLDRIFELDGEEEFMFYAAVCGKVKPQNRSEEKAFYAWVDEEGL